jgi:hypothetical protein
LATSTMSALPVYEYLCARQSITEYMPIFFL